jgi:hypothetical protein
MVGYFEKYGANPCKPAQNAAEWMLEVIGAAPGVTAEHDWTKIWRESSEYAAVQKELESMKSQLSQVPVENVDASFQNSFSSPFHFQLYMCLKRALEQYWRDPSYIYSKLGLCLSTVMNIPSAHRS